ncbi:MAG: polysaccharide deacetylase family protein, partial [Clostridiales bacterium]|nr:polysaccharide deacetylase family protein [Clostridiales bacterium]
MKNRLKSTALILLSLAFLIAFSAVGTGADNGGEQEQGVYLPILMYHSFLNDASLQNDYTVSPSVLESDLKYFTSNGYTTVTVNDLVEYVYSDKPLPEKCVMLTFDDGYYNNYYYAFPLLKQYGCREVISPIVSMTEKFTETADVSPTYGHISAADIIEMVESGYVEIQNHSYDMHSLKPRLGVSQKSGESDESYKAAIAEDITAAQTYLKENVGITPNCFVYPFGEESDATLDIIRELGFVCTLTC